jgi:hypothetical protein
VKFFVLVVVGFQCGEVGSLVLFVVIGVEMIPLVALASLDLNKSSRQQLTSLPHATVNQTLPRNNQASNQNWKMVIKPLLVLMSSYYEPKH